MSQAWGLNGYLRHCLLGVTVCVLRRLISLECILGVHEAVHTVNGFALRKKRPYHTPWQYIRFCRATVFVPFMGITGTREAAGGRQTAASTLPLK